MALDRPNASASREEGSACWSDDPVARKVEWTPLTRGGWYYITHRLRRIDAGHLEFQPVILASVGRSALPVLLLMAGALWVVATENPSDLRICWEVALSITSLTFLVVAVVARAYVHRPQFDLSTGRFLWTRSPRGHDNEAASSIPLAEVHALQLLMREDDEYYSYELNLVMRDASRVGVLVHRERPALRRDASELGRCLHRPVWDRTARPPVSANSGKND